jgi:hypothetical protein
MDTSELYVYEPESRGEARACVADKFSTWHGAASESGSTTSSKGQRLPERDLRDPLGRCGVKPVSVFQSEIYEIL